MTPAVGFVARYPNAENRRLIYIIFNAVPWVIPINRLMKSQTSWPYAGNATLNTGTKSNGRII
jgi:hypothetical protein